jgi:hypothetical protein
LPQEKNRKNIHLLTGTAFSTARFSVLPGIIFRFFASRFLPGTTPTKRAQSDQTVFSFGPTNVMFLDLGASQMQPEQRVFFGQTETAFWPHAIRLSGSYCPRQRFHFSAVPFFADRFLGADRPCLRFHPANNPFCPGRRSVFFRPAGPFSSPLVILNRMEAVLHTAPSCQRAALSGLSGVLGAALLSLHKGRKT